MRINTLKEIEVIMSVKEKMTDIVRINFNKKERETMAIMMEESSELFWEIMVSALDQIEEGKK